MPKTPAGRQCSLCGEGAVRVQGHQYLCAKHYRFGQMRTGAKRHGKVVPTPQDLDALLRPGNRCADCDRAMVWLSADNRVLVASLQHYRDGSMAIVCRSCNTRHAFMPGDTYRDMPKDHKYCPKCKTVKPFDSFTADNGRTGLMKLKSWCRQCSDVTTLNWQRRNRDHYNAKQREGRARRALSERIK